MNYVTTELDVNIILQKGHQIRKKFLRFNKYLKFSVKFESVPKGNFTDEKHSNLRD